MNSLVHKLWTGTLVAAAAVLLIPGIAAAQAGRGATVPVPQVTGPLQTSALSFPFLASERNLEPLDLATVGYVEEEFIVSGNANVYDWSADGSISIKTPNVPYGTRILVRRPSNAAKFSGNVIVELMNSARRFDWPMMWGYSRDFFVDNGDAWIGITMPNGTIGLKMFNPTRYSAVTFANPSSAPCAPGTARSDMEEGLRWDAISQIAALLRSTAPGRPLASLKVEGVLLTMQGADLLTYINAIHPNQKLASGRPVFDGYLSKSPAAASRISQCATAPAAGDPRRLIGPLDVPIIAVVAQGEVIDALPFRRPDSDTTGDRFRLYEIAGAAHIDKSAYASFASFAEQNAAAGSAQGTPEWPFTVKCEPEIPLMAVPLMTYAFDSAFFNLEQWVRKNAPAPRGPRLSLKDAGTPQASVMTDANGQAVGGIRTPLVDVPASTYATNSAGPGVCREMGKETPYDQAKFRSLYSSTKDWAGKISKATDLLVKDRWLTPFDAKRIKKDAQARTAK